MKQLLLLLLLLLSAQFTHAQQKERPAIWGISKITFLVSDFDMARNYYGRYLGFDEAFSYRNGSKQIISFKVNDRQFLEFIEDKDARDKKRMVSVSFEIDNPQEMYQYLVACGESPTSIGTDGAGNEVFTVKDPSGNLIEFIRPMPSGLHRRSAGQYLSDRRISKRIHHVGLYASIIQDNDPFYTGVLAFTEQVRYPEDKIVSPTLLYLGMDNCTENIEHYFPNDENVNHPCFLVEDMQETIYTLKERKIDEGIGKPMIGKGKRWIMNMSNPDGTRVEFTEAFCVK